MWKSKDVVASFKKFLMVYKWFRENNNLSATKGNPYEVLAAMTDKLGRISRYIKHQERNDSKEDWPQGMTEEITGLLVYSVIILNHYDLDISEGMESELNKAIEQHSKDE